MSKERTSLGTRIVEGILYLMGRLPLGYHRWWGRRLAWLFRSGLRYRQDVVMTNLARSFPAKRYDELKDINKRFYTHFGTVLTEMIWFGACRGPKGRKRLHDSHIVEITNPEEMKRIYDASSQIMILQAHSGNWELFGGINEYTYGAPMFLDPAFLAVTYHRMSSPLWETIMSHNRPAPVMDQGFHGYVASDNIIRFVLENKEKKFLYNFIADQYPYNGNDCEIDFMHQKTKTATAAARLAVKLDMAVVYLSYQCREEGGYRITFIPITEHAKGMDALDITKRYYQLLEVDLEEQPWNYLWTHKRWK
jgi:KDO2-lipid IV(A) lauroyltransferase